MITEKQINNIHRLSTNKLVIIYNEIVEALGIVTPDEYCEIMDIPRQTYYSRLKAGKIKTVKISDKEFPVINDSLLDT